MLPLQASPRPAGTMGTAKTNGVRGHLLWRQEPLHQQVPKRLSCFGFVLVLVRQGFQLHESGNFGCGILHIPQPARFLFLFPKLLASCPKFRESPTLLNFTPLSPTASLSCIVDCAPISQDTQGSMVAFNSVLVYSVAACSLGSSVVAASRQDAAWGTLHHMHARGRSF